MSVFLWNARARNTDVEATLNRPCPAQVWLETPRNPDLAVFDVARYAALAPCPVAVDATFAPPPAQRLLDSGAHVVVHSATKYLAGHSDALAGVAATRDADLHGALMQLRTATGAAPGSLETWLLLRSLRTLHLRVAAQSAAARTIADALHARREDLGLRSVLYPTLASSPTASVAQRQMALGGGVLAVECRTRKAAEALPNDLRLFRDATSLGGVESLAEWRMKYDDAVSPYLVRLSVGLEDVDDLLRDLSETLAAHRGAAYDDDDAV